MDIEKLICSGIRREIMIRLLEGPERLTKLRPESKKQNVNNAIQPLLDDGLIAGKDGLYSLTDLGRVQALILQNVLDSAEVLQSDFWAKHDLSSIPDSLLKRIGDLRGGEKICPNGDILKSQHNFIETVLHSKEIWGVSSVFFQEWPEMILEAVRNGAKVHLILSPDIRPKLPGALFTETGIDLQFRPCGAAFTVADNTLLLGLFSRGGGIDAIEEYVCTSERAAAWGKALYTHVRHMARPYRAT